MFSDQIDTHNKTTLSKVIVLARLLLTSAGLNTKNTTYQETERVTVSPSSLRNLHFFFFLSIYLFNW